MDGGNKVIYKMLKVDGKMQKGVQTILTERNNHLNSKGHQLKIIYAICKKKTSAADREEAIHQGVIDTGTLCSNEPDFLEQEERSEEIRL
jgi:hypothetical protein